MASARADNKSDLATAGISIDDADGAEAGEAAQFPRKQPTSQECPSYRRRALVLQEEGPLLRILHVRGQPHVRVSLP